MTKYQYENKKVCNWSFSNKQLKKNKFNFFDFIICITVCIFIIYQIYI